jgi:hypothetical protein
MFVYEAPVADRGFSAGEPEHDDAAGDALGGGEALRQARATGRLEHEIDSATAGELAYGGSEIRIARIEDVIGVRGKYGGVLARRCHCDDARTTMLREHEGRMPRRARRAVDQHGLFRAQAAELEHSERRGPVDDETERLRSGPSRGSGHRRGGGHGDVLGERARSGRDDRRADRRARDAVRGEHDLARSLEAGDERRLWVVSEGSARANDVDEVHARGRDTKEHLAAARPRNGNLDEPQGLRAVE